MGGRPAGEIGDGAGGSLRCVRHWLLSGKLAADRQTLESFAASECERLTAVAVGGEKRSAQAISGNNSDNKLPRWRWWRWWWWW